MALTDNLIEFWTLNNTRKGVISADELGTTDGVDRYVTGKIDQAWNASSNKWLIKQSPLFSSVSPWSFACWIKVSGFLFSAMVLRFASGSSPVARLGGSGGNKPVFVAGGKTVACDSAIPLNAWAHLAVAFDLDSETPLSIWLNGGLKAGGQEAVAIGSFDSIQLGYSLPGSIDCIGFWNRSLTQTDVDELYAAGAGWEPGVGSVVTNILWGSTPDTSRILNSRIVRGML